MIQRVNRVIFECSGKRGKNPVFFKVYFEIYCHKNVLHFQFTQQRKIIFTHNFNVSLPDTSQIFLKIDGGKSRN